METTEGTLDKLDAGLVYEALVSRNYEVTLEVFSGHEYKENEKDRSVKETDEETDKGFSQ